MATKPQGVDWGGLIDLRQELFQWLVMHERASASDRPLTAVLKLQNKPEELEPIVAAVADAIYQIEVFVAAGRRVDKEAVLHGSGLDADVIKLLTDDSVEREADRTIRGLNPKIAHVERLVARIASLHVARAKAMGFAPDVQRIDQLVSSVTTLLKKLHTDAGELHRAFLQLSPSMDHEELTLSGCRRFEKQVRSSLAEVGYRTRERASRS